MKTAFCTCVQLGKSCIEEIYRIGGKLDLLITLNDNQAKEKSGRIYLDSIAEQHNVPLVKSASINDLAVVHAVKEHKIDWLFIIGWSQIAKKVILDAPHKGCLGMHPTLLPVGRGRAAIPWAILKGLNQTGVTMFKLDEGVDTGDIVAQVAIDLREDITATELYELVNQAHIKLIADAWPFIQNDTIQLTPQDDSKATVWPGRTPEDGEITNSMTMKEADALVRAVTHPYPGAFIVRDNQRMVIWSARTSKMEGDIKLADGYLTPIDYEMEDLL
jgi:methionyl-tRNA formyltransferase